MFSFDQLPSDINSYIFSKLYDFSMKDIQKLKKYISNFDANKSLIIGSNMFNTFNERSLVIKDHTRVVITYNNGQIHNCYIYSIKDHVKLIGLMSACDNKIHAFKLFNPNTRNVLDETHEFVFDSSLALTIVLAFTLGIKINDNLKQRAQEIIGFIPLS